jgi:hypothetical protein
MKEEFTYDKNKYCYICPNGKILKRRARFRGLAKVKDSLLNITSKI